MFLFETGFLFATFRFSFATVAENPRCLTFFPVF